MNKYQVIDLQLEEIVGIFTEDGVRGFAFDLVKNRSESDDDDFGYECGLIVAEGFDNYDLSKAKKTLNIWEYDVVSLSAYTV
jgi:hypothetical protein